MISGPLSERIGMLALLKPHERVFVLLHLLGGEQRVELARGAVEAVLKAMSTKRKGYGFVRVGVERKTSPGINATGGFFENPPVTSSG